MEFGLESMGTQFANVLMVWNPQKVTTAAAANAAAAPPPPPPPPCGAGAVEAVAAAFNNRFQPWPQNPKPTSPNTER